MADMAEIGQVEDAWERFVELGLDGSTIPITYMNSTAAIKAFTGRNRGTICTSSNARQSLEWAFEQGERIFFLPDQHLGRNTAVLDLGLSLEDCVVYDPHKPGGGLTDEQMRASKVVLWRGHCSVHGRFTEAVVDEARARIPGVNILVHPECRHEVVQKADYVGSTEYIIKVLDAAEPGSAWAIGTELNLVRRLANAHPDKQVTLPGPLGLLLLDDEPHRPPAPGVGAGEPRRGQRGQPDRGRRGHLALGQGRARPDAGPPRRRRDPRRRTDPAGDYRPGAPQIGNQRVRSFSTASSSRSRSRICSSRTVSRVCPPAGAKG